MGEDRKPPERVRVTGLQEAQLQDLVAIEQRLAQHQADSGVPQDHLFVRSDVEIASLRRQHDVYVAEADHEAAGYLAWRDEAPGVAVLAVLVVDPELMRYGIGTRLLRELGEKATRAGIAHVVRVSPGRDKSELAFLAERGFLPGDAGKLPEKVAEWRDGAGAEALGEGQKLWWAKVDGLGHIPGLPRPEPE
jgi:N-acetylglutamate synthase-like GNAT family acetyltransferase